jgi:alpha-ribazole phosphatase
MTVWHWVRHGPTHEKAFVGWRDVPADLSDTARIARLSDFLPNDAIIVSSDLRRASATADAIASNRTRLAPAPDLREFNLGAWDGLHFDAVAARDPDLSRAYWETPGDIAPPQGESWNQVANRVAGFVDRTTQLHPDGHIIAVAHIGVILTQIQRASGQSAFETLGHTIENLSVSRITIEKSRRSVELISHCP